MANRSNLLVIPKSHYRLQTEKMRKTRAIMRPSGKLAGRKSFAKNAVGDKTKVVRITKDFDVNKDKKIDHRDYRRGQIIGRVPQGIRPKSITVKTHIRNGRVVSKHTRRLR